MASRQVYSKRIYTGQFAVPATVVHTLSITNVTIVRDIDIVSFGVTGQPLNVIVEDGLLGIPFIFLQPGVQPATYQWRGRQVFPAGGLLEINTQGQGTVDVMISGYELAP